MKKLIQAAIILFTFSTTAFAQTDPTSFLQDMTKTMVGEIEANKEALKVDPKVAEKLVREHLLPIIDTTAFAKRTLGSKLWKTLSDDQKSQFIDRYIKSVINKYAKGLSLYDGQEFEFAKAEISKKGNARVKSQLKQSGSKPLNIFYYLRPNSDSWLITNMLIDGVNITKSYKTQFLPRIKEIGFDKFLQELAAK